MISERPSALRRLGAALVSCSMCGVTLREPADPFEGPHVVWVSTPSNPKPDGLLLYVCGPQCRRRAKEKRR